MSADAAEIASCRSAPSSAPSSPRNRIKFLCSHGGRIFPRPADGQLKYVGGETRVISVTRNVSFQELMKKLTYLIDGEMILKYRVMSEDLDALVSVKSNEDLRYMFDEIDRYERAGSRLRAFLFPATSIVMENPPGPVERHAPEQRYIDSINGITRSTPILLKQHPTITTMQNGSLVSSACSSPRSPDSSNAEAMNGEFLPLSNYQGGGLSMHRVRSSPSICSLNIPQHSGHYVHQCHPQHHQNHRQPHHLASYPSPKLPIDSLKSGPPERLVSVRSVGRADGVRYQVDPGPQHYHHAFRQNRGNGCCTKWMHFDDSRHFSDGRIVDRARSVASSPISLSPRYGLGGMKIWDSAIGGEMRAD